MDADVDETHTERDVLIVATTTMKTTTDFEPNDYENETDNIQEIVRIPYKYLNRIKPPNKESHSATTIESTTSFGTTAITPNNLNDYVHYNIGAYDDDTSIKMYPENERIPTEKPVTNITRKPSNGHMPQAPYYNEQHSNTPEQSTFIRSTSTMLYNTIQPTSTIKSKHSDNARQTIKYITGDAKTLTVTTTKTTVIRSHTIMLTLTKTKTSTLIDTVTQTLVKPTRVSYEPSIKPTIYTAPVTMKKMSGSTSSIIPNPSFSIYANFETDGKSIY